MSQEKIDELLKELTPLKGMPLANRLEIYLKESSIGMREKFIKKLKKVLAERD